MAITLVRRLEDGATVVRDDSDGTEFALRPGQYARVVVLPEGRQRAQLERFVIENRADPTGGRSAADEQAIETAQNAATGEAHQESERG